MWRLLRLSALVVASCTLVPIGSASSHREVDLRDEADVKITGTGLFVSGAGDVTGDGNDDALIATCEGKDFRGLAIVLEGPVEEGTYRRVRDRDIAGFTIQGPFPGAAACNVSGAGDVNGDGIGDVIVGQIGRNRLNDDAGSAYVVFGSDSADSVKLETFESSTEPSRGFAIIGPGPAAFVGTRVDDAGDVNGDGLADIIVGAPFYGASYVVFGKTDTRAVELEAFENGTQGLSGFRIRTRASYSDDAYWVSGAGDVNGDGLDDVVVGVVASRSHRAGSANVVFGKSDPLPVDVLGPAYNGFRIVGRLGTETGARVSGAGDTNGDGLDDVLVASHAGHRRKAYVIYGKRDFTRVDLTQEPIPGFPIFAKWNAGVGWVSDGGDNNNDGLADVLVGAPAGTYKGRSGSGAVFVIFGKTGRKKVDLRRPGRWGYRIIGARAGHRVGIADGAGDLNGDGCSDLIVGGHPHFVGVRSYLVWGCAI